MNVIFQCCCYMLIVVTVLFSTKKAIGQDQDKIDSLVLEISKNGETYKSLYALVCNLYSYDNTNALRYARKCYGFAMKTGDSLSIVQSASALGTVFLALNKYDSAQANFEYALSISKRNDFEHFVKSTSNSMGMILSYKGFYRQSLPFLMESLEIRRRLKDTAGISIVLNNVGYAFYKMKSYNQALLHFEDCIQLKEKEGTRYGLSLAYVNLGLCKTFLGRYYQAVSDIKTGIALSKSDHDVNATIGGYFAMGVACFKLGTSNQAKIYFDSSFTLAVDIGDERYQADNLVYKSKIATLLKDTTGAIRYLVQAERLALKTSYAELLLTILQDLIALGQLRDLQMSDYQQRYIKLRHDRYDVELMQQVQESAEIFRRVESEVNIIRQQQLVENNEKIVRQNFIIVVMLSGLLLLIILTSVVLIKYIRKRQIGNNYLTHEVKIRTDFLDRSLGKLKADYREQQMIVRTRKAALRRYEATLTGLYTYPKDSNMCLISSKFIEQLRQAQHIRVLESL